MASACCGAARATRARAACRSSCCRRARARRRASRASRRAPTTTSSSRSRRASCWRASVAADRTRRRRRRREPKRQRGAAARRCSNRRRLHVRSLRGPEIVRAGEPAVLRRLRRRAEHPRQARCAKPCPNSKARRSSDSLDQVTRTGVPYVGTESSGYMRTADAGRIERARTSISLYQPLRDVDGEIDGVLVVAYRRHRAVTRARAAANAAAAAPRRRPRKDEFLAMLAHELRNPLAPIAQRARSCCRLHDAPTNAGAAARHDRAAGRAPGRGWSTTCSTSRASPAARSSCERERVRPAARSCAGAVETAQPADRGAAATRVVSHVRRDGRAASTAIRCASTQVSSNLLNNAAKYTEPRRPRSRVEPRASGERGRRARARQRHRHRRRRCCRASSTCSCQARARARPLAGRPRASGSRSCAAWSSCTAAGRGAQRGPRARAASSSCACRCADRALADVAAGPARRRRARPSRARRILVVDDNVDAADSARDAAARCSATRCRWRTTAPTRARRGATHHARTSCCSTSGCRAWTATRSRAALRERPAHATARAGRRDRLRARTTDRAARAAAGFDHHLVKPVATDALQALFAA